MPLAQYTTTTLGVLALAAVSLALASHVAVLAVALVGLRLAGQGLLGHISQSTMARDFDVHRGKALGVAGLGYPLGEALAWPLIVAVAWFGWREAWLLVAGVLGLAIAPLAWWLAAPPGGTETNAAPTPPRVTPLSFAELLADPLFRRVLPVVLVTPLVLTALFLYQGLLGQSRGWSAAWLATAFTGYAETRAVTTLAVGPPIDRYTARILVPLHLLPMLGAVIALTASSAPWVAPAYLGLLALTAGASGSVLSALWAEAYGPSQVAAVRSVTVHTSAIVVVDQP